MRIPVKAVVFKPSYLCDQDCIMCPHPSMRTRDLMMTLEEALSSLVAIRDTYQPSRVEIVGGEPTRYPHFPAILDWFAEHWPEQELHVYTNGVRLEDIEYAGRVACSTATLDISVHASDEETSRAITGRAGRFSKLMAALENAIRFGIRMNATVAVLAQNEEHLTAIARILRRFPFGRVSFRLPVLFREGREAFVPDIVRIRARIAEAIPALGSRIRPELIMVPRCFAGDVPLSIEDGEVVLVDRQTRLKKGRARAHYDDAIIDNMAVSRFAKAAECSGCAEVERCAGMDRVYLAALAAGGSTLVPLSRVAGAKTTADVPAMRTAPSDRSRSKAAT